MNKSYNLVREVVNRELSILFISAVLTALLYGIFSKHINPVHIFSGLFMWFSAMVPPIISFKCHVQYKYRVLSIVLTIAGSLLMAYGICVSGNVQGLIAVSLILLHYRGIHRNAFKGFFRAS